MVSLGVGRGGSPSGAFLEGQQAALTAQAMRNQEAERAQLMQMRAAQESRTAADFDRLEAAYAPGGIFGGAPVGGAGLDLGTFGGGFFGGAQPVQPAPGQAGVAGAFPPGPLPLRPPGAGDLTFGLLRQFEGFRQTPYWDVNAYRTGFGSDTVTLADGRVVKVQPGMTITREDAERDLMRRVTQEFAPRAAQQVGTEIWSQLPEHVTAPLVSVAYNYGSLPRSVVTAVRTGDPEQIAKAVEGLAGHNDGVNRNRRMQEAAIIRSGGQIDSGLMRAAAAPTGDAGMSSVPPAATGQPQPDPADVARGAEISGIPPYVPGEDRAAQRAGTFAGIIPATGRRLAEFFGLDPRTRAVTGAAAEGLGSDILGAGASVLGATDFGADMFRRGEEAAERMREAAGVPEGQPAGLQVRTPTADTVRPRERPVPTIEELDAREAPTPAPSQLVGPSTSISMGDGTSVNIPAGLFTPQATTSDIARGTTVSNAPKRMPALDAMFGDAARIGVERESIQTMMALLQQQLEFARQIRDPRMVFELTGQMALAQTRMRTLDLVQAGAVARTGNFDPIAQALSQMTGQQVQITPLAGGRVNVTVDGNLVQSNIPADQVISAYRSGVDEIYQQQIAAEAAEQSRRSAAFFDMYLDAAEEAMKQQAQGTREMQVEAFKRSLDAQLGPDPAMFTEKTTDQTTGEEIVVVYDRNNPGRPMEVIRFRESPLVPGQFEPVRSMLTDVR